MVPLNYLSTHTHLASRSLSLFLLSLSALLAGHAAFADELLMNDGSRLLGEVVGRENGTLVFKTSYAGKISVKWEEVSELKSDKPMVLMFRDETTTTTQHIRNDADDLIVAADASEPDQTIDQDVVEFINPEPWRTGDGYKFSGHVNFALETQRGNTDKDEIDMDGDLTWRFLHDRFIAFAELEDDRNNGKKTTEKWKANGAYNHFFTRKWYAGAALGFEHDKFADLDLRSVVGPIAGYQWFESKKMNLSTEAGPMYVDEDFIDADDDDYLAAGWGINFDRFLFGGDFVQFYHKQTGLWSLDDTSDVVWNSWTGLRFPLILGLVASTEIKVEYDGGAPDGVDDTDTTYLLKLGYQW